MRLPDSLAALIDYGIIQEVVRPLMSGKEAQVYLVMSEGELRVAKVYKEAQSRTFKHRSEYTEGRKSRNSRDQRAINKRSRHGRAQDEAAWRNTEVEMIYRLRDAGVRVPEPHQFIDGVLVMELLQDAEGQPAPRLGDLTLEPEEAQTIYDELIAEVVKMLCAGVVHGDLSDFNVLMAADGPAVIDFPQSVDPAGNQNARRLLLRDVDNLHRFLARHAPHARRPPYAEEMWKLYEGNRLEPTTKLTGGYEAPKEKTDTRDVLDLIADAREDERERREARGEEWSSEGSAPEPEYAPKPMRKVVDLTQDAPARRAPHGKKKNTSKKSSRTTSPRKTNSRETNSKETNTKKASARRRSVKPDDDAEPKSAARKKSSRRRRRPRKAELSSETTPKSESREARAPAPKKREATSGQSPAAPKKRARRRRRRPSARRPRQSDA